MTRRPISLHNTMTSGPVQKIHHQHPLAWILIRQRQLMRNIYVRSSFGYLAVILHLCIPCRISLAKTKTTTIPGDRTALKTPTFLFHHPQALGRISRQSLQQRPASSLSPQASQTCTPYLLLLRCTILLNPRPPNAPASHIFTSVSAIFHRSPHFPSTPILSALCASRQEQRKVSSAVKSVQRFLQQASRM